MARILAIENDQSVAELVALSLGTVGFEIAVAATGAKVLAERGRRSRECIIEEGRSRTRASAFFFAFAILIESADAL
jgi:hypothetical protein